MWKIYFFYILINKAVILLVCIQMSLSFIISQLFINQKSCNMRHTKIMQIKEEKNSTWYCLLLVLLMPEIILLLNSEESSLGTLQESLKITDYGHHNWFLPRSINTRFWGKYTAEQETSKQKGLMSTEVCNILQRWNLGV